MPAPKDGKKGKKSGKLRKPGYNLTADGIMKRLLKSYDQGCQFTNSQMFPGIKDAIRGCIDNASVLTKFILHTPDPVIPDAPPILIEPLLAAIRHDRYISIKDLHIWDYPMSYENVASLALMMEKPFYQIRQLELMDCLMTADKVERLVRPFQLSLSLTHVMLDYNEFGDEGCLKLCSGLAKNTSVVSLSLCFCRLGVVSGKYLGAVVSSTAIHELYLDGNDLECEGTMELVQRFADKAQSEAFEREEEARRKAEEKAREEAAKKAGRYSPYTSTVASSGASDRSPSPPGKKKKKKGKKKKKKGPPPPPRVGPWISKLHLADNSIDSYGKGANFAPIICLRLLSTLVVHSECFEELDLEDNQVGDLAARELLEALEKREEAKLPPMKVRTTHRLNADTFQGILKLGAGLKKKKKKGKKKKKK